LSCGCSTDAGFLLDLMATSFDLVEIEMAPVVGRPVLCPTDGLLVVVKRAWASAGCGGIAAEGLSPVCGLRVHQGGRPRTAVRFIKPRFEPRPVPCTARQQRCDGRDLRTTSTTHGDIVRCGGVDPISTREIGSRTGTSSCLVEYQGRLAAVGVLLPARLLHPRASPHPAP